jgi:YaiO family outer membrane protein
MKGKLGLALFLGTTLTVGWAAQAQDAGFVQLTYGSIDLSDGYSDRDYVGLNSRFALSQDLAILLDITRQQREEDVTSLGLGVEFSAGPGKLRLTAEGSDSDLGIAPDWKYALGYRYDAGPATGMIYDVEINRAKYDGGITTTTLKGEAIRYFPSNANGSYLVGQLRAGVTDSSGAADIGYDVAAVATWVTPAGLNVGAELGFGKMSYDLGTLTAVNNDYTAFKPFVSYRFSDNAELILRGEFVDTDLYDLQGASISVKFGL